MRDLVKTFCNDEVNQGNFLDDNVQKSSTKWVVLTKKRLLLFLCKRLLTSTMMMSSCLCSQDYDGLSMVLFKVSSTKNSKEWEYQMMVVNGKKVASTVICLSVCS